MNEKKAADTKAKIDAMSHEEMAREWRFAPLAGYGRQVHPIFGDDDMAEYFSERFRKMGGMTKELSEKLSPIIKE